jgi:heme-degrading monooxygenase HmoA
VLHRDVGGRVGMVFLAPKLSRPLRVQTYWESEQAFWDWTNSESFRIAHSNRPPAEMFAGPSVLEIHEVILNTESQ